jgi:hypothetical protein
VRRVRPDREIQALSPHAVSEKYGQLPSDRHATAVLGGTQNPLPARACGFKSHLRHCENDGKCWGSQACGPPLAEGPPRAMGPTEPSYLPPPVAQHFVLPEPDGQQTGVP